MLDTKFIRENPDRVKEEIKRRNMKIDLDAFLVFDEKKRDLTQKIEALRGKQNEANQKMKEGRNEDLIIEMQKIKSKIGEIEPELKTLEEKTKKILLTLPNITHESVPIGKDDSENVVIKTWGEKPQFSFQPKEHFDIESVKDLIDSERGAKVSGSRFWYLKGDLAKLEFALMQYAFNFYSSKGLVPMIVPMLVREDAMYGTGFFPADENEIYRVNPDDDNLFLVGTAEVALAAYHMNENLDLSDGPKKYMGYSSCFRREAGTYGKDMKGILRGHQFNKIEMFIFCKPEESWDWHEKLLQYAEEFLQSLGLCYQVLNMCAGDIGAPNAKKYDIETWMPGQNTFRETNSCSNDTDFQARRLNCRYTDNEGKKQFVHTINNTGTSDRPLIALLENYQQEDGSVIIPEVLRPIFGKDRIG
ncbi:MAG: serine--tRNA ligase [Candidatus Paceibacterota bacterium]